MNRFKNKSVYVNSSNMQIQEVQNTNKFWAFINSSEDEAELLLYGEIASERPWWDWENETVTQKSFIDELRNLGDKKNITVRINSVGGEIFAAHAIYTQLKSHKASITVVIDGLAASAATIVAMAGDVINMPANAMMMIHNPMAGLRGYYNAGELEKMSSDLEKIKESILAAYLTKTQKDKKEISKMMDEETWLTAQEALNYGFIDTILFEDNLKIENAGDNVVFVNNIRHNLKNFSKKPLFNSNFATRAPENKSREIKNQNKEAVKAMTLEKLIAEYPQLVAEIKATAKQEGIQEERARIKEIDEISNTIPVNLVKNAKYESPVSAGELALNALKENQKKASQYLNQRTDETENSGANDVKPSSSTTLQDVEKEKVDESAAIDSIANAANQRRTK